MEDGWISVADLCGTRKIHFWKEGRAGPDIIKEPFVIGHECAGEIVAVGDGVNAWKDGDRIAIKPASPCLKSVTDSQSCHPHHHHQGY